MSREPRRLWAGLAQACGFALLMAAGAQFDLPLGPVPASLQSLAVLAAGAVLGPRFGVAAVLIYLAAGGLGLPVFAGGASGWDRFAGSTAGYLFAFPLGALLVGVLARRGWMKHWPTAIAAGLIGHALLLGMGCAWLALSIGPQRAFLDGAWPFLPGAVVKSALLAAATAIAARRRKTG